jgi:periplasmic protein TonB
MDRTSSSGLAAIDAPGPAPDASKRHFDTFETQFFKQGDESEKAQEADLFDDLDDGSRHRRFGLSRRFILGVAAGTACLVAIGCALLWRSGSRAGSAREEHPALASGSQAASSSAAKAIAPTAAEPTPQAPASNPSAAPAAPTPNPPTAPPVPAPSPAMGVAAPGVAPSPVRAEPTVPAAPTTPPQSATAAVSPPMPAAIPAQAGPKPTVAVADLPAAAPAASVPPQAGAIKPAPTDEAKPALTAPAPVAGDASAGRARCKKAVTSRRPKDILSACEEAFTADPNAADIAVILAKTEFDKGRSAQAMAWSKKALAVDPNQADAYVFIGGAEQSAGHNKAAKEAYKRYLQLAPAGRYAADLRAIIGSL